MAVRVRKLARELNRTPVDLLGVLHALGFTQYRSADDLVASTAEAKLRLGLKQGVKPVPVVMVASATDTWPDAEDHPVAAGGLMAQLVPGVVPVGSRGKPVPPPPRPTPTPARAITASPASAPARPSPPPRAPVEAAPLPAPELPVALDAELRAIGVERAAVDSQRRVIQSERVMIETERASLDADRRRLDAQVRALDGERQALEEFSRALHAEREALDAERALLGQQATRLRAQEFTGLQTLLEERGLRGSDEFERAIVALAQARALRDVLWSFQVDSPDTLRRVLAEKLLLTDGAPPEAVLRTTAAVSVAPERAELPSGPALARQVAAFGEQMLINGLRRPVLVGGRPIWHRLLKEGVDARVELRLVPARTRDATQATADLGGADLVVLWDVESSPAARALYLSARIPVVEVSGGGLADLIASIGERLDR